MHVGQRRLTLIALSVSAFLLAAVFVSDLIGALTGASFFSISPELRPVRLPALGMAVIVSCLLIYLCGRGYEIAARGAALILTFVLPFVFDPRAFDYTVPQSIWIPFIMALAVCSLRWALLVLAVSVILILISYPNAFHNAAMIWASLMIAVLLIAGRLVQANLLREAQAAQRTAEQSETALRKSELSYRTLAEQAPLAIQVFAPDGTTLRVNRAWERLWGVPFAALRRYNIFKDAQLVERGILPLIAKAYAGECIQLPIHEYDKAKTSEVPSAGGTLWIRAFAYPLLGEDGKLQEVVVLQEDVTERVLADEQIRYLAYFDPLTRLPNRRLFMDRLGQALIASHRHKEFGALLILDLDHFKILNDCKGHDAGDQLLKEAARRLRDTVGEDTVSRLGGDEYGVILEGLGHDAQNAANQAEHIAEQARNALSKPYALGKEGKLVYHSTSSIGLTLFLGQDTPLEALLKQAEVALYQAKDAGRNTIRFFNLAMQAAIDARMALEAALGAGLERREFQLYYQPQVNQAGEITGVEALLRWQHPTQGLVAPDQFIPLCEANGLILPLGQWVLDTACAQLKAWAQAPGTRDLQIAVNVSVRQFQQPDFVVQVHRSLQTSGARPALLKLELTESVVLGDVDMTVRKMQQLDALGVGFSLDDFGTGYSSLSYLKRLPLQQLKIDQSFVREIAQDANDAAIVRAILAMSRSLGIHTLAEGVETQVQRDFLLQNGCLAYQGYLFGKPMPIAELENLLRHS